MELDEYRRLACETAQLPMTTKDGRVELVLGLTAATGSVARVYKRLLRDDLSLEAQGAQLVEGVGDVLWYLAMIATSTGKSLDEVAKSNLVRINDRYHLVVGETDFSKLPDFEAAAPAQQRFPRKMIFELSATTDVNGLPHTGFTPIFAEPNAFPNGPVEVAGFRKKRGFELGTRIGDVVNDNARRDDGYRYHDAVHIAFMAVLGWSPVLRGLLSIKRKYDAEIDRVEDGARARDLEEALSAIIAEMSYTRNDFRRELDVDSEVRDVIRRVVTNLEVARVPIWLWAKAIHQGYCAIDKLKQNGGGYILADLDQRRITFFRDNPLNQTAIAS